MHPVTSHQRVAADGTDRRACGDEGATSLTVALLTPLFVVLLFAAVQAALWGHARTEARVAAKTAAVQVARQGVSIDDARASVAANLADADISDLVVSIGSSGGVVEVTVSGRAQGILIGTSRSLSVTEAVPVEELTPR